MSCLEIQDCLLDFYNHKLSPEQNIEIINHLMHCSDCKKELAELVNLTKLKQAELDVPEDILQTAFKKIPKVEKANAYTTLNDLYYSIKIAKQVVSLALQML